MPEGNEMLLDLISQNIKIERPNLSEERLKSLTLEIKDMFESLNGGVMQLEDATQNIVSFCLNLLNKTKDLVKNNEILISSYDLLIEKMDNVATSISNKIRDSDVLFRQNLEIKSIVDRNLDYISKLPDNLIKSMENVFERSNTLANNSVPQNIIKIVDKIINSFKLFENFMRNPFKIVKDYVFTVKNKEQDFLIPKKENIFDRRNEDQNILIPKKENIFDRRNEDQNILISKKENIFDRRNEDQNILIPKKENIFNEKNERLNILNTKKDSDVNKNPIISVINNKIDNKLINERTLAGITNIPLNEQIVLNKTAPGVATKWLAKRLEKGGLVSDRDERGGFISNIKDKLLEGMGLAGGMSAASLLPKILPKLLTTLLNPWVLGGIAAALGGMLLWKFRKPVTEFLGGVKDATGKLVENVKIGVSTKFEEVKDLFISGWESSIESLKTGWGWIIDKWNSVQNIWSNTVDSVKSFWSNIAESASNTYDKTILPLLKNIDNLFSGVFSAGIEEIKKLKPYLDSFTGWMGSFKESIVDFTVSSGNKFLNWIKDLKDSVAPKDLKPGGILGSSIGRDTSEFTKESDVGYKENGINVSSDLESILRRSNIDITKPTLSRVINEEVALQVTYDMLKKAEAGGQYSAVRRNDSGAVSLGVLQWNANRARDYLKNLYKVDPKLFKATMGSQVLSDLKNKDWSNRTFSIEESRNFAKLLEDPKMRAETDRLALQDISKYFKQARELGIEGQRELSLAASMINQYGYAGFKNLLENKLQTTDFDKMVQIIKEDKNFPYRTRRLEEIDQLNNIYKDIKILKEDMSRNINIPETLNSYQQSINSLVVNEIKTGLQNVSENFVKSINDLKTEIKETKNKDDNRGMVEASLRQIDRSYIGNIPKYIMEMMFGLNIGGEDKKLGGIF